jgi:phosphoglycerate dehydrogenase-like enzyme
VLGFCDGKQQFADPELHWFHSMSAGVEHCMSSPNLASGKVLITNSQGLYGPEIAETVMAMALSLSRGIDVYHREQMAGKWSRQADFGGAPTRTIHGQTMLVVGLGGIGKQIAMRAKALGMTVLATRNSSRSGPEYVDEVGLAEDLTAFAARADIVVNATPLTPSTTGIFNKESFAAMKPTSFFINIGRGKSVVTADLVDALESGAIAGAGLDVTDPEPLPAGHKLWQMPRVIITPHVSGRSSAASERRWLLTRENLRRYVIGDPLLSVVNVNRGY